MKRESSIIHTKEDSVDSKEVYLIKKEEQELLRLDKTANILSAIVKVEMVITLILMTFYTVLNGFPVM